MIDKTYILENGLLEQYALGDLDTDTQKEVEIALQKHHELREELEVIELQLEKLSLENAIEPPKAVKKNLLKNITKKQAEPITLKTNNRFKFYSGIAASIALFLLVGSIYLFSKLNNTGEELKVVETEKENLIKSIDSLNLKLENTSTRLALLNSPDTQKYVLKGNALLPNATLVSYVNTLEQTVLVNTEQLPKLDDEHDYQMWADVDGEMINMGIIDVEQDMLAMTFIENAESLNVTIEPKGGSDHPTVSKLITNVYL